jgi:hypothetical protein
MVSHPECCIVNEFTKNVCHAPASNFSQFPSKVLADNSDPSAVAFLLLLASLLFQALLHAVAGISTAAEEVPSVAGSASVLCDVGFCTVAISYSINFNDLHITLTRNVSQIRAFFSKSKSN